MKTAIVIFILILCILEKTPSQIIPVDTICPDCPNVILGKNEESISYQSTAGACKCTWMLPKDLQESDIFSIAILRTKASLTMAGTNLCTGVLVFPDVESSCHEDYLCHIYHTPTTKCKKSEVLKKTNEKGLRCSNYQSYNNKPEQKIEYIASVTPGEKKFYLRYIPIDCSSASSATPATTQTNPTEDTTTNGGTINSRKNALPTVETTMKSYQTTGPETTPNPVEDTTADTDTTHIIKNNEETTGNYETIKSETTQSSIFTAGATGGQMTTAVSEQTGTNNMSSTATSKSPGSLNNTISIVVPLAFLLGLVIIATILMFLWRRGKKRSQQPPQGDETQKFVEVNPDEAMAQTGI